jgi:hypothetical protein
LVEGMVARTSGGGSSERTLGVGAKRTSSCARVTFNGSFFARWLLVLALTS